MKAKHKYKSTNRNGNKTVKTQYNNNKLQKKYNAVTDNMSLSSFV